LPLDTIEKLNGKIFIPRLSVHERHGNFTHPFPPSSFQGRLVPDGLSAEPIKLITEIEAQSQRIETARKVWVASGIDPRAERWRQHNRRKSRVV
jgi:hypothetical protein